MSRPPRILISAGEASGDLLGAALARELRAQRPDVELLGMGGRAMEAAGVRIVQDAAEVAVVGIVEVLRHLPEIRRAMDRLVETVETERPDLVVPIDFPDFNFRLARRAHRRGVGVVYYVSPQVWAWRRGRVRDMKRWARRVLVLFPFEIEFYASAGVPVTFVGHPVVDRFAARTVPREVARAKLGFGPDDRVVALLPGSRRSELDRLGAPVFGAVPLLARRVPGARFVTARAPTLPDGYLEASLAHAEGVPVDVVGGDLAEILPASDAAVAASGTATLEAAVAGVPTVIVYRMRALSYAIGRLLVRLDHVGLPNLVAGERVFPELIQGACRPEAIAEHVERFLTDEALVERTRSALLEVRHRLGEGGADARAARTILEEAGAT